MAKEEKTEKNNVSSLKNCFVITPIGHPDSDTFKKTKGLIESVLKPILLQFGFTPLPAYDIANSGSINRQILTHILNDELVVANLTGLNPNVMYELAVRHAKRKPVVIMAESGTILPFDINDQRTIFYHDTLAGSEEAKPRLALAIDAILNDPHIDNPIYQVVEESDIIKNAEGESKTLLEYVIKRFDQLENSITYKSSQATSTIDPKKLLNGSYIKLKFLKAKTSDERNKVLNTLNLNLGSSIYYTYDLPYVTLKYSRTLKMDEFVEIVNTLKQNDEVELIDFY